MSFPTAWASKRARFVFSVRDVRGADAPLASATKDGVSLRSDLDFSVWNPDSNVSNYKLVEPDDFVIGLRSFQHGISHSAVKGIVSPAYTVLRATAGVEPRFFRHYFRSSLLISQLANLTQGIRQGQAIDIETFRDLPLPLPSQAEQRCIAEFLDAETGRIDRLNSKLRQADDLLDSRRDALMFDCFSQAAHTVDGLKSSLLALRRVVDRWIDYRGATPDKTANGVPLVTAKNIKDGKIDLDASREYIAKEDYESWMRRGLLARGDVLLTTEAPLGQVAMIEDTQVALAQRVILMRVNRELCTPEWLYWYLRSPQAKCELELRATGSTALGIKADRLRGVPIPILDPFIAGRRISQLKARVTQIEILEAALSQQRNLLAERRQALIAAAVTGQFDVSTASGRNVTDGVPTP